MSELPNLDELKHLRDSIMPGPWRRTGVGVSSETERVIDLNTYWDEEICNRPADFAAIAMLPDLLDAHIRIKEDLEGLVEHMDKQIAAMYKRGNDHPAVFMQLTRDRINEILGETNA